MIDGIEQIREFAAKMMIENTQSMLNKYDDEAGSAYSKLDEDNKISVGQFIGHMAGTGVPEDEAMFRAAQIVKKLDRETKGADKSGFGKMSVVEVLILDREYQQSFDDKKSFKLTAVTAVCKVEIDDGREEWVSEMYVEDDVNDIHYRFVDEDINNHANATDPNLSKFLANVIYEKAFENEEYATKTLN